MEDEKEKQLSERPHKKSKQHHKKLARKSAKARAKDNKPITYPLHRAVWRHDVDEIKRLLDSGEITDIDERDCHGNPALHLAVHFRYRDIVQFLIERGSDPTYKNGGMWSSMQGRSQFVP